MLPGVFRLRLPLPWPGVPHCNAWAVAAGEGFVLFDTGMHQPDSLANLERALEMCSALAEGKPARSEPVAYVCRGRTCSLPIGEPSELASLLALGTAGELEGAAALPSKPEPSRRRPS